MFGRGVRLKGRGFSLKRSAVLDGSHPPRLDLLETLNIFSINGDYLAEFKKMLDARASSKATKRSSCHPVSSVRYRGSSTAHAAHQAGSALRSAVSLSNRVSRPQRCQAQHRPAAACQAVSSHRNQATVLADNTPVYIDAFLPPDLFDWEAIHAELLVWKRQRGLVNLLIDRKALRQVLEERRYDSLRRPPCCNRQASPI